MRAATYAKKGPAAEVLRVEDVPTPTPGPGEVRVKLALSGVNPSDVKSRAGTASRAFGYDRVIPHSDGAGIIDAVGAGVPASRAGTRVWVFNAQWERPFGTAAEYVALPADQAVVLPEEASFEIGASIGIPLMTAYHAIDACGSLIGRTVAVFGAAGAVGYYVTQLAALAGARVIAVVSDDAKAALSLGAGASEAVLYRSENVAERIRELTAGRGVDAAIEVDAATNAPLYGEILAHGGKVVVYGSSKPPIGLTFGPLILNFVSFYFFIVYKLDAQQRAATLRGIGDLLRRRVLKHPPTAIYPLADIVAAHERVERGANAKVLVSL